MDISLINLRNMKTFPVSLEQHKTERIDDDIAGPWSIRTDKIYSIKLTNNPFAVKDIESVGGERWRETKLWNRVTTELRRISYCEYLSLFSACVHSRTWKIVSQHNAIHDGCVCHRTFYIIHEKCKMSLGSFHRNETNRMYFRYKKCAESQTNMRCGDYNATGTTAPPSPPAHSITPHDIDDAQKLHIISQTTKIWHSNDELRMVVVHRPHQNVNETTTKCLCISLFLLCVLAVQEIALKNGQRSETKKHIRTRPQRE